MADIFDEVDDILADVETEVEEVPAEIESNFNESELLDIMAEIESLEKEFETETSDEVEEIPVKKNQLQEEIERELVMSSELSEEVKEEFIAPVAPVSARAETGPTVFSLGNNPEPIVTPVASQSAKTSEISFSANGQMNLSLSFKVGNETATLVVDPILGLVVTMKGVELCISEVEGCKVTMENGVNFTIPLTTGMSASKKKAA